MSRIRCTVDEIELPGDYTDEGIPSVEVTCSRCGHSTEIYGTSDSSIRRCLVMLRHECPRGERHYYVADGDGR
jgi:hypothetical protein